MGMEISESINSKTNYLDMGVLGLPAEIQFSRDTNVNLVNILPTLSFSLGESIDGFLQGDFYMEHNFNDEDDEDEGDEASADLSGAYLSFRAGRAQMDIGIQPVQFGNGRILIDDAPALNLKVDAGDTSIDVMAARVLDHSPVVGLTFGYSPGFLEQVSLFGIWYQDADDAFANSIPVIYQVLQAIESEGDLYWVGVSADLFIGKAMLSLIGAYQTGKIALLSGNTRYDYDVSAFYGELSLDANLSESWSAGAFCVMASGDRRPLQEEINAFISIQSYHPRAAIFFDPQFLDIYDQERLTFGAGPFGGVIAPGLNVSFVPMENLRIDATAATFYAHEATQDDDRWFGWELDLDMTISIAPYYTVYVQAARFWHGDVYDAALEEDNPPATRLVMGLRADF